MNNRGRGRKKKKKEEKETLVSFLAVRRQWRLVLLFSELIQGSGRRILLASIDLRLWRLRGRSHWLNRFAFVEHRKGTGGHDRRRRPR